jgi:ion channel-forming bestrophin family protein
MKMKFRSPLRFVKPRNFWSHVMDRDGDGGQNRVQRPVIITFLFASLIWFIDWATPTEIDLGISVAPYEFAGAILGSLLVLRANSGLDRWWEGRKLWGAITNQSRNLAIIVLANGPDDPRWRREIVGWIAAFGHVARRNLRRQKNMTEIEELVGPDGVEWLARAEHRPTAVSIKIARLIRDARDQGTLDPMAFLRADEQRSLLIDHIGGCERINKTPLATAYVILIRRFIVLFLATLPFALLRRVEWLTPFVTVLVAYPILALDHIADDLQQPFLTSSINHLPLNDITTTIESNLLALLPESDE